MRASPLFILCLVKQPKQAQRRFGSPHVVKGVIRKDEGDRLRVEIDGEEISVSKLFVYPDFSKTVGQIEKNPRKNKTPSEKNPRKSYSTSIKEFEQKINDGCVEEDVGANSFRPLVVRQLLETNDLNPRKTTPPSTKRRKQGEGTGYIECKPIKRSGKEYKQYWYHYEEWREGDRTSKKSCYIPKRLVAKVEKMEAEKVSVREILAVLISKGKRSQK